MSDAPDPTDDVTEEPVKEAPSKFSIWLDELLDLSPRKMGNHLSSGAQEVSDFFGIEIKLGVRGKTLALGSGMPPKKEDSE
jgi:hypothetical protein